MVTSGSLSTRPLRPLGVGGILGAAWQLYQQNFVPLIAIVAIVQVAVAIVLAVVATVGRGTAANPTAGNIVGAAVVALITILFVIIATFLQSGALTLAIADDYLGQPITVERAFAAAGNRLGALIGTSILTGVAVLVILAIVSAIAIIVYSATHLAALATIIGVIGVAATIYYVLRWVFIAQTVMLEQLGGLAAMRRSAQLVVGSWWRTFGILLLTAIIVGVIASVIEAILGAIVHHGILGGIVNLIVQILIAPFYSAVITLLYFDLRVRKDQLTHETLASSMGGRPSPFPGMPGAQSV